MGFVVYIEHNAQVCNLCKLLVPNKWKGGNKGEVGEFTEEVTRRQNKHSKKQIHEK